MSDQNKLPLRILVCQTAALSEDVKENLARWENILAPYTEKDDIDVVQFPETAFSRYFFKDAADAAPSMEVEGEGPVFEFLSLLAKRLGAYVIAGYMERRKVPDESTAEAAVVEGRVHGRPCGLNSLYLLDPEGKLLRESYHKRHLFQADYTWCRPGQQDQALTLQLTSRRWKAEEFVTAGLIICQEIQGDMDDRDKDGGPAGRRLRNASCSGAGEDGQKEATGYHKIDVILYSTCWPLFLSDLPEPPSDMAGAWERAVKSEFLLREGEQGKCESNELRRRPLVFSAACCVGSEKNVMTPDGWGERTKLRDKFCASEILSKRGCSGVKVYSVSHMGHGSDPPQVNASVPASEAHAPPAGVSGRYAGEPWKPDQQCMSWELEEARIFSLHIECAP